jgi:DNA-binding Lrp family transcriptional regulator
MAKACILIKTVPTASDRILESLRKMKAVTKAYIAYGRWDVVVFIDASMDEIGKISATINSVDGVRTSETLPEA